MATSSLIADRPADILLVWPETKIEMIGFRFTASFTCLLVLSRYVCTNIKNTDAFLLIIPRADLQEVLDDSIYRFVQVKLIYVYHNNNQSFEKDKAYFEARYPKLRFCYEHDLIKKLERPMIDNAVHPSRSIDRTAITNFASSVTQRISAKKPTTTYRNIALLHGFTVKNMDLIDERFICPICRLLIREPWQLGCGHRICQSCINVENNKMNCSACFESSLSKNIWPDKGFRREMEKLLISCAICDWTETLKRYEEHIEQDHQEHVNQRDLSNNPLPLRSTYPINNDNQRQNPSIQIQNKMTILSTTINMLNEDRQRIFSEICSDQRVLEIISKELSSLRSSFENDNNHMNGIMINSDILHQEISLLKQDVENRLLTSSDGTFLWKITGIEEKIVNAKSGRQTSIYSPAFYSSPTGYKLCMRLFLNGDFDVRGQCCSLFIVIIRSKYDAILQWPFPYKITFCLIDQSNQHNISNYIWPEMTLRCFQRPVCSMNEDYGIKDFFPIELLRKYPTLYLKDDVMFIKSEISFTTERPGNSGTGTTSNSQHHVESINEDITRLLGYPDAL